MTVTTELATITYTGNGSTEDFPIPFKFFSSDHIQLTLVTISTGAGTLVPPADYTVTGAGEAAGGSVNYLPGGLPMSALYQVRIDRVVPLTQDLNIIREGNFDPAALGKQLDLIVMQVQQLKADLAEAISGDTITSITQTMAGPGSATGDNFPAFNGGGGALLKDSGFSSASFALANHTHPQLAALWTELTKSATKSITTNATLASDADFTFTMEANTTYLVEANLYLYSPNAVGFKVGTVGPASPSLVTGFAHEIDSLSNIVAAAITAHGSLRANTPAANEYILLRIFLRVENGNNAGAFALQFAQNASSATATLVYKGSTMKYRTI